MSKTLRSGYTTGTHATAIFGAVLSEFYNKTVLKTVSVVLPDAKDAKIEVSRISNTSYKTTKVDNDDMDVTKGCVLHVEIYEEKPKGLKEQNPSYFKEQNSSFYIYGGVGVGIVTKKGLKIEPTYPAINPVPLLMMEDIASYYVDSSSKTLHVVFSVEDGEEIAKQTANAKVGVIGGISILGTKGIVKPVSASAYIDSIEAELGVIQTFPVFTLGNSAFDEAKNLYDETQIIEIGNFIYDSSELLRCREFEKLVFITSVAKMAKVAQGFKNTHNRFGTMDFAIVREWMKELHVELGDEEFLTLKAVLQILSQKQKDDFVSFLCYKVSEVFKAWFKTLHVEIKELDIITIYDDKKMKKGFKW